MMGIVIQLIIFLIALALIMLASMWYTRMLIDKMVGSKHRDLEVITSSGTIPMEWSSKYDRKMIRLRETGKEKLIDRVRSSARKNYLRKLSRLGEYVRRSRFIENEDVRKRTLHILQRVEREWRAMPDGSVS